MHKSVFTVAVDKKALLGSRKTYILPFRGSIHWVTPLLQIEYLNSSWMSSLACEYSHFVDSWSSCDYRIFVVRTILKLGCTQSQHCTHRQLDLSSKASLLTLFVGNYGNPIAGSDLWMRNILSIWYCPWSLESHLPDEGHRKILHSLNA